MNRKRLLAAAALAIIGCFGIGIFTELAAAQDSAAAKGSDKSVGQRRGVAGSLAQDKGDDGKKPTRLQMGVGLGSVVVAFVVIKWL